MNPDRETTHDGRIQLENVVSTSWPSLVILYPHHKHPSGKFKCVLLRDKIKDMLPFQNAGETSEIECSLENGKAIVLKLGQEHDQTVCSLCVREDPSRPDSRVLHTMLNAQIFRPLGWPSTCSISQNKTTGNETGRGHHRMETSSSEEVGFDQ